MKPYVVEIQFYGTNTARYHYLSRQIIKPGTEVVVEGTRGLSLAIVKHSNVPPEKQHKRIDSWVLGVHNTEETLDQYDPAPDRNLNADFITAPDTTTPEEEL